MPDAEPPRAPLEVPGWRVRHLPEAPSTNVLATEAVRRGEAPGLVVLTDHQTAGRGRLDRGWETPAGVALTFSAVVDPGVPDEQWPWLPLAVGLAVSGAVERLTGARPGVKWPNDVLLEDRKLAGILVERVAATGRPALAVLGVGLNLHQRELPVPTATSLALALGASSVPHRDELLRAVLDGLTEVLGDWAAAGSTRTLATAYAARSATLGRRVRAELPGGAVLEGVAEELDPYGRLVVRDAAGSAQAVGAGDVVHLRATS